MIMLCTNTFVIMFGNFSPSHHGYRAKIAHGNLDMTHDLVVSTASIATADHDPGDAKEVVANVCFSLKI